MRKYLEIKQELTDTERIEQEPEMIRVEVKDEEQAIEKARELKDLIENPKCELHSHHHDIDSSKNRPCTRKVLDLKEPIEELKDADDTIKS